MNENKDILKAKLRELYLMEASIKMNRNTSEEELKEIKEKIVKIKKEYTKLLLEEKENQNEKRI